MAPKRTTATRLASGEPPSKQRRGGETTVAIAVSALSNNAKNAAARILLKELKTATIIASDAETARRAVPFDKNNFPIIEYKTATPLPQPAHQGHLLVMPHDLARPSRLAETMTTDTCISKLVTVLDARSFLNDMEERAELQSALVEASRDDERAHMIDMTVPEVLTDFVESADVIVLSYANGIVMGELDEMTAMLKAFNPFASIVRLTGRGVGSGKLLEHVLARQERPPPKERSGWWHLIHTIREVEAEEDDGHAEEDDGHAEEDHDDEQDDSDAAAESESDENDWSPAVVSRFTFFARRPFHPARLLTLLSMGGMEGVVRSSGIIWIASHPEDAIKWDQVGPVMNLAGGMPWLHTVHTEPHVFRAAVPADLHWAKTAEYGDRRIELGFIGMDCDHEAACQLLRRALVTEAEFKLGAEVWVGWEDEVSP